MGGHLGLGREMRRRVQPVGRAGRVLASALALLTLLAAPLAAHPHEFIDVSLGLRFSPNHELEAIGVVWHFDTPTSLLILAEEGMDPDRDGLLTEAETARLRTMAGDWAEGYEGDLYLERDGAPVALSGPEAISVELHEGRLVSGHLRRVLAPFDPAGQAVELRAYDPDYYIFYHLADAPQLFGAEGCRLSVLPPDRAEAQVKLELLIGDRTDDEMMLDDSFPRVGRSFADLIELACPARP